MADNYRNKRILQLPAQLPTSCKMCGSNTGVVAAHSNQGIHGKSKGKKAHDCFIAYLCDLCHHQLDQGFLWTQSEKEQLWNHAHEQSIPLFQHLLDAEGMRLLAANGHKFGEELWRNQTGHLH